MPRVSSAAGELARRGFRAPERASAVLAAWGEDRLVDAVVASGEPDLVIERIERMRARRPSLLTELAADAALAAALSRVVAVSDALGQHLENHPDDVAALRERPRARAQLVRDLASVASSDELRLAYRRALLPIVVEDLSAHDAMAQMPVTAGRLADLADAVLGGALALAVAELGDPGARIALVAMGKSGGHELNYVSDVDVIAVAEPDDPDDVSSLDRAAEVVAQAMRICSAHTAAGTIWEVDAALRPEGKRGPLVRTLASMATYYEQWAEPWEFQALLKARPAAGDLALGQAFCELVAPRVWAVGDSPDFVPATQAMRRRVVSLLPAKDAVRELKLGAGGLRDIEFTVQLLQLIHGRADERLRVAGTLDALAALVDHGYVGRADGAALGQAYRAQRVLEHRVQLLRLRRTHLLPKDAATLERLSRGLGEDVESLWRTTSREVRRLHQRMFYSPLLAAVATLRPDELVLTSEQAQTRLASLGYRDPTAALRHIQALTSGLTRRSDIQRQLLPALLGWFAEAPLPDAALLAFRRASEALGDSPWYLRALRDEGAMAQRFAHVLGTSRLAVDLLLKDPASVQLLADDDGLRPRSPEDVLAQMRAVAERQPDATSAAGAIRAVRRRELFRLAAADICGVVEVEALGAALSALTSATVEATLGVVRRGSDVPEIGVVALGRWGGGELSFASDADVVFVLADVDAKRTDAAMAAVAELRRLLTAPGPDPALVLDADLRPEGKNGPLVRTVASCRAYWEQWAQPWEAQAMLRAAHGAGSPAVTDAFLQAVGPLRWPVGGPSNSDVAQMRRLKARMETERMPRGTDAARHLKLGPGGLSDVEWCVQLLQLRGAAVHPELRSTSTLPALAAAVDLGLVEADDAAALRAAWLLASRARNAIMLTRGRASDVLPTDSRDLSAVAQHLGWGRSEGTLLLEAWRRAARRARFVVDRLYWTD